MSLLTDFRFVGPTDERYVTGGGVGPVWHFVTGGVKIGQKKRYVIVERPPSNASPHNMWELTNKDNIIVFINEDIIIVFKNKDNIIYIHKFS